MKLFLALALLSFSLTSFASWNEVECEGRFEGKFIRLEVEQSFPNDSYFKRAELTVEEDGSQIIHDYTVSRRAFGFNRIQYASAGLRLEVDLWPDQRPRWGMRYRGELQSSVLGNRYIKNLNCRFPNAF